MANAGGGVDDEGRKWWHVFPLGVCADPTGRAGRIRVYWDTGLRPTPWVRLSRRLECPNPSAASDILADGEIAHVVTFTPTDFKIRHPLVERLGDALATCELHAYCAALDGPPTLPGRYRVVPRRTGGWSWATLPPKPGESL